MNGATVARVVDRSSVTWVRKSDNKDGHKSSNEKSEWGEHHTWLNKRQVELMSDFKGKDEVV